MSTTNPLMATGRGFLRSFGSSAYAGSDSKAIAGTACQSMDPETPLSERLVAERDP